VFTYDTERKLFQQNHLNLKAPPGGIEKEKTFDGSVLVGGGWTVIFGREEDQETADGEQ